MAIYKAKQILEQTVVQVYLQEFDTESQEQWESLKDLLDDGSSGDYPEKAPDDPGIWFDILQKLDYSNYDEQEEDDWVSDRDDTTKYSFKLENSEGDLIDYVDSDE
jgi:hypothetical protein